MSAYISYFGKTNFRQERKFGILQQDRLSHMYVLGKTGTGKSTLLRCLFYQDLLQKRGCCLLDPLGDLAEQTVQHARKYRKSDYLYLDLTNPRHQWRYNPLKKVSPEKYALVTGGILNAFSHVFQASWGDRIEHILRYTFLALLEQPHASFKDILPLIQDDHFRKHILRSVKSKEVQRFWTKEFPGYRNGSLLPLLNKIGSFLAYPSIRRLLYDNTHDLHLREVMDKGKVLIVNLAKGVIGADSSTLIGSLLITSLGHAAFSRADTLPQKRRPFMLYVDEFQSFRGANLPHMLAELRKYSVGIILANQYLDQIKLDTREAVLGNVGTFISFRVGGKDAPYVAREFQPKFEVEDLVKLPNYHIYLKLLVNGKPSIPFSATTLQIKDLPKLGVEH